MTERGLPIVDGPVACPFVAFADDRDERSTSPDHRHRCYAEATPAPRALAHQEAYCLASAFPVCPTFQDWARREAAHARNDDAGVPGQPIPGLIDERPAYGDTVGGDDEGFEPVYEDRPRKSSQKNWASPPPWAGRGDDRQPGGPDFDEGAGLAGGAAAAGAAGATAGAGGLSGSFADRLVSPQDAGRQQAPMWRDDAGWDDAEGGDEPAHGSGGAGVAGAAGAGAALGAAGAAAMTSGPDRSQGPPPQRYRDRSDSVGDPHDPAGHDRQTAPSWERPARLETYPSLRERRIPQIGVSSLVLAAIAIVLAAVALFFLPGLLGIGSSQVGSSPSPSVAASVAPASLEPTLAPEPTQQIYIVQSGDTMSKIAKKFHVPLQTLIDANKQIANPDRLKIGDQVIIPIPAASTAPAGSPAASP
jgi:LysM repeat protein